MNLKTHIFQLEVQVVSCEPSTLKVPNAKAIKGFDVIFNDTILFPEGGGQVSKPLRPKLNENDSFI